MKKSKFSESQIIKVLKENEQGRSIPELARELGIDKIVPFNKIKKGKRTIVFSSIIRQLISLNPNYEKEQLLRFAHYINRKIFSPNFF
ncbi:hypothetical protein NBRC110019_22270 [Neptunitalea chrysea]|uniref:Transposase n=1 Tax=Neptunitalea chrysea TaxID=1647581 RepID=A0A9W6B838_9FLAO|nr:hypothetical protein NBRC110019_22270 [Neptunitalea chrysea]